MMQSLSTVMKNKGNKNAFFMDPRALYMGFKIPTIVVHFRFKDTNANVIPHKMDLMLFKVFCFLLQLHHFVCHIVFIIGKKNLSAHLCHRNFSTAKV